MRSDTSLVYSPRAWALTDPQSILYTDVRQRGPGRAHYDLEELMPARMSRYVVRNDGAGLVCSPPPTSGCSQEFEACTMTSQCCGSGNNVACINNRCAQLHPHG